MPLDVERALIVFCAILLLAAIPAVFLMPDGFVSGGSQAPDGADGVPEGELVQSAAI